MGLARMDCGALCGDEASQPSEWSRCIGEQTRASGLKIPKARKGTQTRGQVFALRQASTCSANPCIPAGGSAPFDDESSDRTSNQARVSSRQTGTKLSAELFASCPREKRSDVSYTSENPGIGPGF